MGMRETSFLWWQFLNSIQVPRFRLRTMPPCSLRRRVLGSLLAELHVAMPSLASCGFVSSLMAKSSNHSSLLLDARGMRFATRARAKDDASSTAVAAIAKKMGVDKQALAALVQDARST